MELAFVLAVPDVHVPLGRSLLPCNRGGVVERPLLARTQGRTVD